MANADDQNMNEVTDNDETREEEPEVGNNGEETKLSEANQSKEEMPAPEIPEVIPDIIPDSMDIKINFLDQLQDKLDILSKSKSTGKAKWSRNTSDKNVTPIATNPCNEADLEASDIQNESSRRNAGASESESQLLANMNFENLGGNHISDETCLSEDQALRELNNSRSRWGPSSGSGNNNNLNKKKSRSIEKVIDCDLRRRCVICLNSIIN